MPAPGYKRVHKEMRKVVPKYRRFDLRTVSGRLKHHAYEMDMTRAELAAALGVAKQTINCWLITKPRLLKAEAIDRFCIALALDERERTQLHQLLREGKP